MAGLSFSVDFKVPDAALFKGGSVAQEIAGRELRSATEFGLMRIKQAVLPLIPVNLGILRNATQSVVLPYYDAGALGRVYNPMVYAMPMEEGTKPYFPPPSALVPWVNRKLGIGGKQAEGVAFCIARKIAKRGLKARHFFRDGFAVARPAVQDRFSKVHARTIKRLSSKGLA